MEIGDIDVNVEGGLDCTLPPLIPIDQHFERKRVHEIQATVDAQLAAVPDHDIEGKSIAITVGSRGIANLPEILCALLAALQSKGGKPFVVPAMGSHGGATVAGQIEVLAGYGITEERLGVPIRASMDVVKVCELEDGTPLYIDRIASEADSIVIANKIKPHADFKADYESGLVKMLCVGLGKHAGAMALHHHGFARFPEILPRAATRLLDELPVLFGLAILENAFDELMQIEVVPRDRILAREKELLEIAKRSIGRLPFAAIDLLIVDEIGKNISGEGMDPNVTGRPGSRLPGFQAPDIQKVVVLDVTPQSHGNGVGIGIADLTTRACVEKIDLGAMYTNAITATILDPAKLPVILNTDRDAICVALKTCVGTTPRTAKIVRIHNTLELHRIWVSPSLLDEVDSNRNLTIAGPEAPLEFEHSGRLRGGVAS
jgi:hypothetical protein